MNKSLDKHSGVFADNSVHDLAIHVPRGVNGKALNEPTALYARFLEIAFHDKKSTNHDRALAACWVRAVESIVFISLENQPDTLQRFLFAKSASLEYAAEWGYGSVGFIATHEPLNLLDKTFAPEGANRTRDAERDRQHFLLGTAFGREADVS